MANGKSGVLTWTSGNYTVQINWSENYNDSAGTSNITIDSIEVKSASSSNIGFYMNGTITINGTVVQKLNSSTPVGYVHIREKNTFYPIQANGTDTTTLICSLSNIAHDSDGSKSINIEIDIKFRTLSGQTQWSVAGAQSIMLTTSPKASTVASAKDVTLGSNCSITWTPASESFVYTITFSLGDWSHTTGFISPGTTNSYTYSGYTIPADALPNSTSGTMTATLTTYDSNRIQVGSSSSKTFKVSISNSGGSGGSGDTGNITGSITPGTITLAPVEYNYLVQGKNKLTISVSGWKASSGSSIQSYTFYGPGISVTTSGTSVTSANNITTSGTLTYTVTATDNRGLTASKTATIQCYEYAQPSFISFNAYRVASSDSIEIDSKGTYVRCTYEFEYSPVVVNSTATNSTNVIIGYKTSSESEWETVETTNTNIITSGSKYKVSGVTVLSNIDADSTYLVGALVTDNYGAEAWSNQTTLFGDSRILNIRPNGSGIAFGKMADNDNLFECTWNAAFYNNINCTGILECANATFTNVGCDKVSSDIVGCNTMMCEAASFGSIGVNGKDILDLLHPVGSIYQRIDFEELTSPIGLFGGNWIQMGEEYNEEYGFTLSTWTRIE